MLLPLHRSSRTIAHGSRVGEHAPTHTKTGRNIVPARCSGFPRIRLDHYRPVIPLDPDSPTARGVASWQGIRAHFVNVITTRRARADYGLDLFTVLHIDEKVIGTGNAKHGGGSWGDVAAARRRKAIRCGWRG
jgi:hypothetical protein